MNRPSAPGGERGFERGKAPVSPVGAGEGLRHTWTLAGWDPVFGTFKSKRAEGATETTRGVIAAYRQP